MRLAHEVLAAVCIASTVLACQGGPTAVLESSGGLLDARKCESPPCNSGGGEGQEEAIDYIVEVSSEAAIISGGGIGPGSKGVVEVANARLETVQLRTVFGGQCFESDANGRIVVRRTSAETVELEFTFQAHGADGGDVEYEWTWVGEMEESTVWLPDDLAFIYLKDWDVRATGPGKNAACEGDGSINWGDAYVVVVPVRL